MAESLRLRSASSMLITIFLSLFLNFSIATGTDDLPDLGTALAGVEELSTFYGLIKTYPEFLFQLPTSGGITILAPSNAAFDNIIGTSLHGIWDANKTESAVPILLYHVLNSVIPAESLRVGEPIHGVSLLTDPAWTNVAAGQGVFINKQPGNLVVFVSGGGARSILKKADIPFKGGLVQVIDNLLIPPGPLNETLTSFSDLSFLGALYAAGLYEGLANTTGNYTIFAPSIPGFQVINSTLANLTQETLNRVLQYHVVPNKVLTSEDLLNDTTYMSILGNTPPLHIHRSGNNLYVNSAQVIQSDILLDNGMLHIIDNVLNPSVPDPVIDPSVVAQVPVFDGAVQTSTMILTDLPFTTALPCTSNCPVATANATSISTSVNATRASTTSVTTATSKAGAAALARCTDGSFNKLGLMGAIGLGAAGLAFGL